MAVRYETEQPVLTPAVSQMSMLPTIDREGITKFINEQGYLTYIVRAVKINSYLKSLMSLAGCYRSSISVLQKVERRRGKRWKRPRLISINIYVMLNIGTSLKNQKWITNYITGKSTTGVKRYLVHMAFCSLEHSWTIQNSSSQFY